MSRWIDADALVIDYYDDYETKEDIYTHAYVSDVQIYSAPSIDIVRCEECKWYGNEQKKIYECCTYWAQDGGVLVPTKPDDFCSYGVKKGAYDD